MPKNKTKIQPEEHALSATFKAIKAAFAKVQDAKNRRGLINAEIKEARESVVAKGVGKKPFDLAMAYIAMDEEQRLGFDRHYAIAREALGAPIQGDLFDYQRPGMGATQQQQQEPPTEPTIEDAIKAASDEPRADEQGDVLGEAKAFASEVEERNSGDEGDEGEEAPPTVGEPPTTDGKRGRGRPRKSTGLGGVFVETAKPDALTN